MRAYVGLGSNLGDREATLRQALTALGKVPGVRIVAVSTFRETDPVGFLDQPCFLNGAAAVETDLSPQELLGALLEVERGLGRTRGGERYGPRTIDLDLLVYSDLALAEDGLEVPHPRLQERRFALEPLAELAPGLEIPGKGAVEALLAELD